MPNKTAILNFISIVFQYGLIMLIYLFLFRVLKLIYQDLKVAKNAPFKFSEPGETAAANPARLLIIDKGSLSFNQTDFLLDETISIGRGQENDVVINDTFVSHEHACITKYKAEYWLSDLGSTNFTYLNEERVVGQVLLKPGDLIKIGAVTFKFAR
ncbi:MAG: FHA domain-containing protein [Veillonellales bacterium]